MSETSDLAGLYRETRERLMALIAGLDPAELSTEVPACPGWAVRDVLAHLAAIPEDAAAGRLTGIPTDEFTAEQVAGFADVPVPEILARWSAIAPQFERGIAERGVWPAVIDLATHEQDIRGAVGQPGARDCAAIRESIGLLLTSIDAPAPIKIITEDHVHEAGGSGTGAALTVTTSRYEAFRWRMGRRSPAQLAAMDWSPSPPEAILAQLTIFGPSVTDIHE